MKLKEDNTSRFLLVCGILAPILMMAIIIVVGAITPDYSPISGTISQMGTPNSPFAFLVSFTAEIRVSGDLYIQIKSPVRILNTFIIL